MSYKNELLKIYKISQMDQSHGDHLVLCFVSFKSLKTYCYLSLKQIKQISKDFNVSFLSENKEKTSWFTLENAKNNKFILNIGVLYLLNQQMEWQDKAAKSYLSKFKKTPIIQLLLSDQPEIFHEHKTSYSYKKIFDFVFSDFSEMDENSIAVQIYKIDKLSDLSNFLFGESNRKTNKLSLEIMLNVSMDCIRVDFYFIRFILFVRKFLEKDEVIELISKHKDIKKSSFYRKLWHSYLFRQIDKHPPDGMITFFQNIKDFSNKKRLLLNWNIPAHVIENFNQVMEEAYPKFNSDLDKISDPLYFYNTLSRDYGRLFIKNFKLTYPTYAKESLILDNYKTDNFSFKIPKSYHELVQWGSILNNCAGNFDQIEHYSTGLLIGVFKNEKLTYLIDYRDVYGVNKITQIKGYKNCLVKEVFLNEIFDPFLRNNLIPENSLKEINNN